MIKTNKIKPIYSIILPLFFLVACSKAQNEIAPPCVPCYTLSDKYTIDTVYVRTDTLGLINNNCLSGHWLEVFKTQKDTPIEMLCWDKYDFRLERWRYSIGGKVNPIYIKK